MAQVFHSSMNSVARLSIIAGLGAAVLVVAAGTTLTRSSFNTMVGVPLDQPVPFSHEHHAVELGIDCRYCHQSVETSAFAGIPPTQTCMSCHSQIWTNSPLLEPVRDSYRTGAPLKWNRVNSLPDFVYFNHSIHVNRGINCNFCHGPIEKMMLTAKGKPFFMAWCLNCHRDPAKFVRPKEEEFNLYWKYQTGVKLTGEEQALIDGDGDQYTRSPDEYRKGQQLVAAYHIQQKQLTDCWTCHR